MPREKGDVPTAAEGESQLKPTKKNSGAPKIHGMRSAEIFAKDPRKTRCKRTDGRRWRCSRDIAGPNERYCSVHLIRKRPERARARSDESGQLGEPSIGSADGLTQSFMAAGPGPLQAQVIGADQFAMLQRLVSDNGAQGPQDLVQNSSHPYGVDPSAMQRQFFQPSGEQIARFPYALSPAPFYYWNMPIPGNGASFVAYTPPPFAMSGPRLY